MTNEPSINIRKASWSEALEVGHDSFELEGAVYHFTIVDRSLAPDLPNFAGMPNGDLDLLFVSDELIERNRAWAIAVLTHEVYCNHLWVGVHEQPDRCSPLAAVEELKRVPLTELLSYLRMRIEFCRALLANPNYISDQAFERQIRTLLGHYELQCMAYGNDI